MRIPDLLDTSLWLYRDRFVTFLLIALVVYVPYSLLAALALPAPRILPVLAPDEAPEMDPAKNLQGLAEVLVFAVIFMPLCSAALTHNISAAYLGKKLSAAESYRRVLPKLAWLLLTQFLSGVSIFLGSCACFVPGVILALWFYVVVPIVVLEGVTGPAAMFRSRELTRGNLAKIFLVGLLAGIAAGVLNLTFVIVLGLIPWPYSFMGAFFQYLAHSLLLPVTIAPITLVYYDLRIRKEAFDLQMLSAALEEPATT
jgi:hypothetical protein